MSVGLIILMMEITVIIINIANYFHSDIHALDEFNSLINQEFY